MLSTSSAIEVSFQWILKAALIWVFYLQCIHLIIIYPICIESGCSMNGNLFVSIFWLNNLTLCFSLLNTFLKSWIFQHRNPKLWPKIASNYISYSVKKGFPAVNQWKFILYFHLSIQIIYTKSKSYDKSFPIYTYCHNVRETYILCGRNRFKYCSNSNKSSYYEQKKYYGFHIWWLKI